MAVRAATMLTRGGRAAGERTQGSKHVLRLREGSTEATRVVASLLSDLIERGLEAHRMRLWVIEVVSTTLP